MVSVNHQAGSAWRITLRSNCSFRSLNLQSRPLSLSVNARFSLIKDNHTQISHIAGYLSMNTSLWNKDRIIGQKKPLQISHIWGIRNRLELEGKTRDLALLNMALDSKLRGCDLVKLKVSDVAYGSSVSSRATVLQQKTGSPVQFEITKGTR